MSKNPHSMTTISCLCPLVNPENYEHCLNCWDIFQFFKYSSLVTLFICSEMDLGDVKAIIRSLLVSSTKRCSLQQLLSDFHNETGSVMPTFKYSNHKNFLTSLTDTVKVAGRLNEEYVTLVKSHKSSHIESLVCRQGKMSRCYQTPHIKNLNPLPDISSDNKTSGGTIRSQGKKNCSKTGDEVSKPKLIEKHNQINSKDEGAMHKKNTHNGQSYKRDKNVEESNFLFREDEIANLCPEKFQSNLANHSLPASCNSDTSSEIDSVTVSLSSPSEAMWIPDSVKKKLKKLIGFQTRGIWCCELPELYNQFYNSPLDYKEYGFRSLIEMVMSLNEIFRCVRPYNEDWLLFDASKPPSQEEKSISSVSKRKIPDDVEKNATSLLESLFPILGKSSVEIGDFLLFYFIQYGVKLEFREYGYPNIKGFMTELSGRNFTIEQERNRLVIKPVSDNKSLSDDADLLTKPDDKLCPELFPDDVCFDEKFTYLNMEEHFKVGKKVNVVVADVWSPSKFSVQLKRYGSDFKSLVNDLGKFYNEKKSKYGMPAVTLRPGQVCVALNKSAKGNWEWHRSEIVEANKSESTVKVRFVDYGMDCLVKLEDVRFMHRKFLDLPAQCFAAKLWNLSPASTGTWPRDASERFLELVSVPSVTFIVQSLDLQNKVVCGKVFPPGRNSKESVGDVLVKEGKAVFTEDEPGGEVGSPVDAEGGNPGETEEGTDPGKNPDVSSPTWNDSDHKARTGIDEGKPVALESTGTGKAGNGATAEDVPPATHIQTNNLYFDMEKRLRLSWSVAKEIDALAYNLLSEDQFIRGIARNNFDFGLQCAKTLAEGVVFSSGPLFMKYS